MSVEDTDKIDFVARTKDGTLRLVVTDHLEWGDDEHLFTLQAKLDSYLGFVESGQLLELEEAEEGMPVAIEVIMKYPPDDQARAFLFRAGEIVGSAGIALSRRVMED